MAIAAISEDDIYRTSTQYRLWSFTRESLLSLRSTTNSTAAGSVRAALESLHSNLDSVETGSNGTETQRANTPVEVDCLTVEQEQKLVGFYCVKAMQFADFCDLPTNVKATAVQYLKRFYLSNSPMTYHPKEMMPSALFLATKTENHYTSLKSFVSKLPKTTAEDVIAPEFLLTQGLRFTFDVRHPQRGLEGGFMELLSLARGHTQPGPDGGMALVDMKKEILNIDPPREGSKRPKTTEDMILRIQSAHGKAKDILKTSALLTDAYFFYTPSQIWLSALLLADQPLARFYIDSKFTTPSTIKPKLMANLANCGEILRSSPSAEPGKEEMAELTKIDKKLYKCRNPDKIDLVSISKAQKRDGGGKGEDELDEKVIKKRKLEREKSAKEADDIFGPPLRTTGSK